MYAGAGGIHIVKKLQAISYAILFEIEVLYGIAIYLKDFQIKWVLHGQMKQIEQDNIQKNMVLAQM